MTYRDTLEKDCKKLVKSVGFDSALILGMIVVEGDNYTWNGEEGEPSILVRLDKVSRRVGLSKKRTIRALTAIYEARRAKLDGRLS